MSVMSNDLYIKFEEMDHKIDLILEIVAPLATLPDRVKKVELAIDGLQTEMHAVKTAVSDTNKDLARVEKTVKRLDKESKHHTAQFEKLQNALHS